MRLSGIPDTNQGNFSSFLRKKANALLMVRTLNRTSIITLWLIVYLCSCASPTSKVEDAATEYGLSKQTLKSRHFSHLLYSNNVNNLSSTLHVYIEGDGTPWVRPNRVSADPTPRNPVALHLMAVDPEPSIYLGRPCYFGLMEKGTCTPLHWTHQRYSEQTVDSMLEVLELYLTINPYSMVSFIGYSGGGVLAMLLAERLPQTTNVITIAANLDIDAWVRLHGYSALDGSLNPAKRSPLDKSIKQIHFAGGKDQNVPASLIIKVTSSQRNSVYKVYADFDHRCCWIGEWPAILRRYKF